MSRTGAIAYGSFYAIGFVDKKRKYNHLYMINILFCCNVRLAHIVCIELEDIIQIFKRRQIVKRKKRERSILGLHQSMCVVELYYKIHRPLMVSWLLQIPDTN